MNDGSLRKYVIFQIPVRLYYREYQKEKEVDPNLKYLMETSQPASSSHMHIRATMSTHHCISVLFFPGYVDKGIKGK